MRNFIRNSLSIEDSSKSKVPLSKRSNKGIVPLGKIRSISFMQTRSKQTEQRRLISYVL